MTYRLFLVAALFITGCATTNYDSEIGKLKKNIQRLDYYIAHEKCFISYNKCMVEKGKKCWPQHEKCVVTVWKQFSPLLK